MEFHGFSWGFELETRVFEAIVRPELLETSGDGCFVHLPTRYGALDGSPT